MSSGNWMNNDGLYLQYGTSKATPETGGEYLTFGETRLAEITVDLTTLTSSAVIQSNTLAVGSDWLIEQVEVYVETATVGGTSFSVGLVQSDRTTSISDTALVSALVQASTATLGDKLTLNVGSTSAGAKIGTTPGNQGYVTVKASGTYSAGKVIIRVRYRVDGTISQ